MTDKSEVLKLADELKVRSNDLDYDSHERSIFERAAATLRAAAASAEPVGYGYSAEIQSAPGNHLHVSREKSGIYDTPLYTHPDLGIVEAQLASARKALEPFAKIAPLVEFTDKRDGEVVHRQLDKDGRPHELTKDDFRTAAAAYTDEKGGS